MIAKIVTELPDKANRVDPRNAQRITSIFRSRTCHIPAQTYQIDEERRFPNRLGGWKPPVLAIS